MLILIHLAVLTEIQFVSYIIAKTGLRLDPLFWASAVTFEMLDKCHLEGYRFRYFGVRNTKDFHDFGMKDGINFYDFSKLTNK